MRGRNLADFIKVWSRLGVVATFNGAPFLKSQGWHGALPWLGEVHLSSVLLFDLGVYMLVVGATVLILIAIAHQTLRTTAARTAAGQEARQWH